MHIRRATIAPSRTVSDPEGRVWTIRTSYYRHPHYGDELDEDDLFNTGVSLPGLLINFVMHYLEPLLNATVGRRPWIVASTDDPPVRMVWRVVAAGRYAITGALDEIALALERGDMHPTPGTAQWIGYD